VVEGRFVVRDGELATADLSRVLEIHARLTRKLIDGN